MTRLHSLASVPLMAWLAMGTTFIAGCQQPTTSVSECTPACPTGSHCEATGCVADSTGGERDLAVAGIDQGKGCTPACSGATPICQDGICVVCVADTDCPIGQICKLFGQRSTCAPGCSDDSRCGGGSMKCCNGGCTDTAKDSMNCGVCGTACMANHAGVSCAAGQCTIGTCAGGWADCNANPADGCEVNVRADAANCSGCGMACALPNAVVGCSGGCYIRACHYGWDDCNAMDKDGCETNVAADVRNCGACGMSCAGVARAKVGCVNAACALLSCDAGFADCDGQFVNGCEVGTTADINNCGGCGMKCGQGLVCVKGECTCPNCNLPNAKAACINLKCVVGQCNQGYGDCDGQPQNGCERTLLTDILHCGVCGNACAQGLVCTNGGCTCPQCNIPGASSKCINNVCAFDKCLPGFGNCDNNVGNGCEADFQTDKNNCSACGKACAQNEVCVAGVCGPAVIAVKCADMLINDMMWGKPATGIDLRKYTNSTLHYIGCNGDGCTPQSFYCTYDANTQTLQFGSAATVVRAAADPNNSLSDTMPNDAMWFNGCCTKPLGLCNAPGAGNNNGVMITQNGQPVTNAQALCWALGYKNGTELSNTGNGCPQVHALDGDGAFWSSNFVNNNNVSGKEWRCTTFR